MKKSVYEEIINSLNKIEEVSGESVHWADFADAVAKVMEEDYGSHNYENFLNFLNKRLK